MKKKMENWIMFGIFGLLTHCATLPKDRYANVSIQEAPLSTNVFGLRQEFTVFDQKSASLEPLAKLPEGSAKEPIQKRPAVILLHSGFGGDSATRSWAKQLAQHGFITIMPSYRGEKRGLDGERSEGRIEFCSGEVDDAQSALQILRTRPDVDLNRIVLIGASHGGCIAFRTAIREPQIRAVVTFSAPVAAAPLLQYLKNHFYHWFFYAGILAGQLQHYVQGSPASVEERYLARSPLFSAQKLTMPILIIHGDSDQIVPIEQACWLSTMLRVNHRLVKERRFDRNGEEVQNPTPLCRDDLLQAPSLSNNLQNSPQTELWVMSGQDHIYHSIVEKKMKQRVFAFLQPILEENSFSFQSTHSNP